MKTKIHLIYKEVYKTLLNSSSLKKFKAAMFNKINFLYPNAKEKEKHEMYRAALKLRNSGDTRKNLEQIIKAENRINRNEGIRANVDKLKKTMKLSRDSAIPVVFYLCSHHAKPAKDHEKWEKKLYVDRFWKSNLKGKVDEETLKTVGKYVKNNNIRTVQWVTGAPVYMVTRSYCRHYFIPITTFEVLNNSLEQINQNHPEAKMYYKTLKDKDKGKRFYKKKVLVHKTLMTIKNKNKFVWLNGYCNSMN